jgi:methylphosphotriester-DNA--protein-cysteine methyltransferase
MAADAAAETPDELHHLFRRWAGLTPKAFMQALTLDHAKNLLRRFGQPLLETRRSTPAFRDRAGCTIYSSPMRRCRRATGRPAAAA